MNTQDKKITRGYIFSRQFMGERVPQHIQNAIIRDYCSKNNLVFLLSATEYAMEGNCMVLKQVLSEIENIDGIVAYSVFQLPENNTIRNQVLDDIILKKKEIHFAVESIKINNYDEKKDINNLWLVKKAMKRCLRREEFWETYKK